MPSGRLTSFATGSRLSALAGTMLRPPAATAAPEVHTAPALLKNLRGEVSGVAVSKVYRFLRGPQFRCHAGFREVQIRSTLFARI